MLRSAADEGRDSAGDGVEGEDIDRAAFSLVMELVGKRSRLREWPACRQWTQPACLEGATDGSTGCSPGPGTAR